MNFDINLVQSCTATEMTPASLTWEDLRDLLGKLHRQGEMTLEEYQSASGTKMKADKDGPAWIPCSAVDATGPRKKANMNKSCCLVLDIDSGMQLADVKRRIAGLEAVIHSSYSHSPEKPKWRVVLPLVAPISAGQITSIFDHFQEKFDHLLDAACGHDPSRLYYLPACPKDAEHLFVFEHLEGTYLDGSAIASTPVSNAPKTTSSELFASGTRNTSLTGIAGRLRKAGKSQEEIEEVLQRINVTRCDPPLNADEVRTIAASIAKHATGEETPIGISITDTGNAQRLVRQYGDNVKFIPECRQWLVWQDEHWSVAAAGKIMQFAKATAKSIFDEVAETDSDTARMALSKHASRSLNIDRLRSMIALAESEPGVVAHVDQLDKDDFIIGVRNGVIDLHDGKFRPAERTDLITKHCGTEYHAEATCPTFDAFLARTTGGDASLQDYLQRLVGYILTGSTREHCFVFLYGLGANGKSTFVDIVMRLLGGYSTQVQPDTLMTRRSGAASNDLARLAGQRLVSSNEVPEGAHFEENLLKQLVGGDIITARFLHKEFFDFRPKLKLLIAGNHKPIIKGNDEGIWRRVHLVPFVHTVPESERDRDLAAKLVNELPGILNWAIAGCLEWQKRGLDAPNAIREATAGYREEMDILGSWIDERCEVGTGLSFPSTRAYRDYSEWCDASGIHPLSVMVFRRKLAGRGVHPEHRRHGNVLCGLGPKGAVGTPVLAVAA